MKAIILQEGKNHEIDFSKPLDISLLLSNNSEAASAWYCPPVDISPVITEHFVGAVNQGGSVNFNNILFNPHGNGTHTECVGHIAKEFYSVNDVFQKFFFLAQLVSLSPLHFGEDQKITLTQIQAVFDSNQKTEAFVLRTMPNNDFKKNKQYTNTNPPFVEAAALDWLYRQGIRHFLIDTPSVDKEVDGGLLAAHHAYWNYPNSPRLDATITELIYVENAILDGFYLLNLQMAAFANDASPSRPVLYKILS